MNWKEHAHLFIGFQVITSDVLMNIHGIERWISKGIDSMVFILEKDSIKIKEGIDSCTLIARKIEDMTEGERMQYEQTTIEYLYQRTHTDDTILYLLSIGVYPFDQSAFETGEVIDTKTL